MAHHSYDAFVNNDQNPFAEQLRQEGQNQAKNTNFERENVDLTGHRSPKAPEDSENDEEAPNSGFVIHVATEPGKGKATANFIVNAFVVSTSNIGLPRLQRLTLK